MLVSLFIAVNPCSGGICSGAIAATFPAVHLRENRNQVLPPEGAEAALLHIPVAGAAVILRAGAAPIDMLPTQGRVQRAECFPYLLGLSRFSDFEIDEMATGGGTHLAFCLLNEQRFTHSHKGGTSSARDTGDMGSDEGAVGSSSDNGGVHKANG